MMSGGRATAAIMANGVVEDEETQARFYADGHAEVRLPLLLKLVLLVLFIPQELSFFLGDLRTHL